MYRAGFARFSSYRYNTHAKNLGDNYVHLTNVAIQKTGPGYDAHGGASGGRQLKMYLIGKFGIAPTDQLSQEIQDLCVARCLPSKR